MGVLVQGKCRPSALGPLPVRRVPPDYCYVFMDAAMTTSWGDTPRNKWRTPAKAVPRSAVRQHQQRRQNAMSQQQAEQAQSSTANAYGQAYAAFMAAKGFPDR